MASLYGLSQERIEEIQTELSEVRHCEEIMKFEERLDSMESANDSAVNNIIFNWKEEYRRISRV